MKRVIVGLLGTLLLGFGVTAHTGSAARGASPLATPPAARVSSTLSTDAQDRLVAENCSSCHDDETKTGGLSLEHFSAAKIAQDPAVAERMIRKLRAGMMPPPSVTDRPAPGTLTAFAASLEASIDQAAANAPNPGRRPFQRLSRAEYANAVHDLLSLIVDVNSLLPPDVISSHGFDNISNEQAFSPTLLEGYLLAASKISRLAVGDRNATPSAVTYNISDTASQMRHVDGAPIGTRGGLSVEHIFPADGQYVFTTVLYGGPIGDLFGAATRGEQIEISIDGERVALLDIDPTMYEADKRGLSLQTPAVDVKAGPQRVSAAFIRQSDGPVYDLVAPIEFTLGDTNIGNDPGVTGLPHLRKLTVSGPYRVTGVSDTVSRRKIFACRPMSAAQETPCAEQIIKRLATQAYRGNLGADELADLMRFYDQGSKTGDFESGIRLALQAILANPQFLFRIEQTPPTLRANQNYRISDLALASRLSFFLWATVPDAELLKAANQGTLRTPAVLDKQVRRMLADPRSETLATRFASEWLRLRDLDGIRLDHLLYPNWDQTLVDSARRETELLFNSLVHEDRSVLDLLTADYTFVNERLAKHYGIPNVMGNEFQRVPLTDLNRRGVLGEASILMLTSAPDRTSPVLRGKWVMTVLLGTPPPPPPPNVPAFEETKGTKGAKPLSVRERMEEHRANPACTSCHRVIDPLGLALDNFDATGAWRVKDNAVPVDATGVLYDGSPLNGPASLREALLKRSDIIVSNFTENLMTYALGRPVDYADMPAVRAIVREASPSNRFSSLVMGIVKSAAFQMSSADGALTTDATPVSSPSAIQKSSKR